MRKRKEREEPCAVCWHYHNSEGGEACEICGHHDDPAPEQSMEQGDDFFPSVIIEGFLYFGSYHHASCCALLKTIGITRILNSNATTRRNAFLCIACLEEIDLRVSSLHT